MTSARSLKLQSQGLPSGSGTICARQSANTLTNCDRCSETSVAVRPCAACVRLASNSHSAAWQAPFRKFSSLREFTNCFSTGMRKRGSNFSDAQTASTGGLNASAGGSTTGGIALRCQRVTRLLFGKAGARSQINDSEKILEREDRDRCPIFDQDYGTVFDSPAISLIIIKVRVAARSVALTKFYALNEFHSSLLTTVVTANATPVEDSP